MARVNEAIVMSNSARRALANARDRLQVILTRNGDEDEDEIQFATEILDRFVEYYNSSGMDLQGRRAHALLMLHNAALAATVADLDLHMTIQEHNTIEFGRDAPMFVTVGNVSEDIGEELQQERSNEECSICLCVLKKPRKLDCDHAFCIRCIHTWSKHARTCPTCRTIF